MKNQSVIIYLQFILLIGFSCSKSSSSAEPEQSDNLKPSISLIDPSSSKVILVGSALTLEMDLSDNKELKSYKVDIRKSLKNVDTSDWSYVNTWQIAAGKTSFKVKHSEISIPTTVTGKNITAGNYEMVVTCSDISGNEAMTMITISLK
jgi:hypothetical protein